MNLAFFASLLVFILVLHHNLNKVDRTQTKEEDAYWEKELSANKTRKKDLDDLVYITFNAEPFYPVNLLDPKSCPEFFKKNPEVPDILSRFLFLEKQKIVNLTQYSNTDLKYKYGVANLTLLTEYDTNYNELITLLQNYGNILEKEGYTVQALTVLEYAVSIGTDISNTYMLCGKIYKENNNTERLTWLKKEAENISTSRKESIVRKLQEFDPCNG